MEGLAACGLEVHPPQGPSPPAGARCQTRERPRVPPDFSMFVPKKMPVLRGCGEEQLFWRSPAQNRMARGATSGMRDFPPLWAPRIEDFTCLIAGVPAGCVRRRR